MDSFFCVWVMVPEHAVIVGLKEHSNKTTSNDILINP